jgi:hypothetical protein
LSPDAEFAVFDLADFHEIFDDRGWLYGIHLRESVVRVLGTEGEQIAAFPSARPNEPWHGYPLWPRRMIGPENRRGDRLRPPKAAFLRMEVVGLITQRDRKRLMKGDRL